MEKKFIKTLVTVILFVFFIFSPHVLAKDSMVNYAIDPHVCTKGSCPPGLQSVYTSLGETCVSTFDEFKQNPTGAHFWVDDPDVTSQGKSNERARQFISWVLNKNAIDDHPTIKTIWNTTRNVAYFMIVLVAALLGIGFIVGQRANFNLKVKVWPTIGKIAGSLLYITFSAAIVLLFIQLSELLMKFFIEDLGGKNLFNIYFASQSSQETNYVQFVGCRDLNFSVQEAAKTELLMMKITNVTYYAMGIMLILRKIILWFLLFVSPFLAVLFSFSFIRNIGWIWIGVFFQWIFYGPLFALFLGGLSRIWREGLPFVFDFTRAGTQEGYIYPTAINILYGGPSQTDLFSKPLSILNNGNYVDTFVEYVITIIMLWAVIFFPWLLLRYFRSYCCDGIEAMKNILLSMYDQSRNNPPPPPSGPTPNPMRTGTTINTAREMQIPVQTKLETLEEIKKTKTEEISKSLNLTATKLTDIAKFETNRQTQENVRKTLDYIANPTKAQTPAERQKFMNIRTELFNRAIKSDTIAKQILSATTPGAEQIQNKQQMFTAPPQMAPVAQAVSYSVKIPKEKVSSVTNTVATTLSANNTIVNSISQNTQVPAAQVQTIITTFKQQSETPPAKIVQNIAQTAGVSKEQVVKVIQQVAATVKTNKDVVKDIAQKENVRVEDIEKVIETQIPLIAQPEQHIEQAIAIPPTVSIEDYEEVKKMWIQQYDKGEVPITENISSREQWIEQDNVFITNTLNKLLSQDEQMKQQGLDEVGFILPIFMLNNLKGDELLVYLKAKLEAAKFVSSQMEREKELTERLKAKAEEVLVDVPQTKKEENAKTMTMEGELDIPEETNKQQDPQSPESTEEKPTK